jgi:hypothetical protein
MKTLSRIVRQSLGRSVSGEGLVFAPSYKGAAAIYHRPLLVYPDNWSGNCEDGEQKREKGGGDLSG